MFEDDSFDCSDSQDENDVMSSLIFSPSHNQLIVETFSEYFTDWEAYCRIPEHEGTILWYPDDYNYISLSEDEFAYWNDLYLFMKACERRSVPKFAPQTIDAALRADWVNWMLEVGHCLSLERATIYSAESLFDTLYASRPDMITHQSAQCIGLACVLLACKMEEVHAPTTKTLAQLTHGKVDYKDIAALELQICMVLNFRLKNPSICDWLNLYFELCTIFFHEDLIRGMRRQSNYVCDLVLHSAGSMFFTASSIAAALLLSVFSHENLPLFKFVTGYHSMQLQAQLRWIRPYLESPYRISFAGSSRYQYAHKNQNILAYAFISQQIERENFCGSYVCRL